jgi:hypothetical protein
LLKNAKEEWVTYMNADAIAANVWELEIIGVEVAEGSDESRLRRG